MMSQWMDFGGQENGICLLANGKFIIGRRQ